MALSANIVKDTSGIAELTPNTRQTFDIAVKATLGAFTKGSGVAVKTQVEILEALGRLGAAVKQNLIEATKASLFQVRSRAIDMLLQHVSDDELFQMSHISKDSSREPIKKYVEALWDRDAERMAMWLASAVFGSKAKTEWRYIFRHIASKDNHSREFIVEFLKHTGEVEGLGRFRDSSIYENLYNQLVDKWPEAVTREFLKARIYLGRNVLTRELAILTLAKLWSDDATRKLLNERSAQDVDRDVRTKCLELLVSNWQDESTRQLLTERAVQDESALTRIRALTLLVQERRDEVTRSLLNERSAQDADPRVRTKCFELLVSNWQDESTRQLLTERAVQHESAEIRLEALMFLGQKWPDESTRKLLFEQIAQDKSIESRGAKFCILGGMHTKFASLLISQNLNGARPFCDPLDPIPETHIQRFANLLGAPIDQIEQTVQSINIWLGWDIRKGLPKT